MHRVGRVGRAGEEGFAYTLADYKEEKIIGKCERQLKIKIPKLYLYEGKIHENDVKKASNSKSNKGKVSKDLGKKKSFGNKSFKKR